MMPAVKFLSARIVVHAFSLFFYPPKKRILTLTGLLLLPVAGLAQVSYTGTAATQNFGSQAIGSASAARAFNFSVAAGTTVGSIAVVTQGAPNLDFTTAAGGTCAAQDYASATTCTVNVTLKPKAAGLRMGAVVFFSAAFNTGTVLGKVPVYGIGTGGPQIAFNPSPAIAIDPTVNGETLNAPVSVAVDAAGDLFIADLGNKRVVEVPPGSSAPTAIDPTVGGSGLAEPFCLAVDGAGDLFIGDGNRVVEVPPGDGAAIAIDPVVFGDRLSGPEGLAVDGAGDLFISDSNNFRVVEVPAGGGSATAIDPVVDGKGLDGPAGLAVDGSGNLFVADQVNDRVVEVPANGGAATAIAPTVSGESLFDPVAVAVDAVGDLFILDTDNDRVVEVPTGGGSATAIVPIADGQGLSEAGIGIALDAVGDLFIGDGYGSGENRVVEVQRSKPPTVNFTGETYVGSMDTADGTKTVEVQNIGNEALTLTALSYPADFPEASGDANACTDSTSLSAGHECDLPIEFAPQDVGLLDENLTITDNALNVAGTKQSIAVSGTSLTSAVITSPAPGSALTGTSVTFVWTAVSGATDYDLWLGFNGAGSSDLYNSGIITNTSSTVTGLPTKGTAIYTRLYYEIKGVWRYNDYTYTEAASGAATMISPLQGATLGSSNVMFSWTAGTLVTNYALWLGTSGPGSSSLYASPLSSATSVTVPKLPARGTKIYARLYSEGSGGIQYVDYTYTEQ